MAYTMGSLFDGSGGFPLAGTLCGIRPVWASEIEPYPIAVTRSRFPDMKHLGDISKINGAEIEPVDVISFGSPCQDLSVAGKRAGLKHEVNGDDETTRSGLFMEAVRIIKEMRRATNGKYPRIALWENVPGAFSSNRGEDFRVVLEELIKIVEPTALMPEVPKGGWAYADSYSGDGWSIAYRVLDAQYWGVPQRRRRIYLVADFGGQCARKISFEREGLRGHLASSRPQGQGAADNAEDSVGASGGIVDVDGCNAALTFEPGIAAREGGHIYEGVSGTLRAKPGDNQMSVAYEEPKQIIIDSIGGQAERAWEGDIAPTLKACHYKTPPCVTQAAGFCTEHSAQSRGVGFQEEMSPTLRAGVTPAIICKCYDARGNGDGETASTITGDHENRITDYTSVLCMATQQGGAEIMENKSPTITAAAGMSGNNQPVVCLEGNGARPSHQGNGYIESDKMYTLNTIERHAVCYAVEDPVIPIHDQATRFSGKHGEKTDGKGNGLGVGKSGDPMNTLTNGDRHAVCYAEPMCMEVFHCTTEENKTQPLKARDYKDPLVVAIDRAAFNQGQNALYAPQYYEDGTNPTLVARGPSAICYWDGSQTCGTLTANNAGGNQRMPDKENFNGIIEKKELRYIVRRLTPTECARLQGFPDKWGHIAPREDFSDEEYRFWLEVRNTYAAINGKAVKDYTEKQMLTWYNKLHTDSSEYKMWGNGIALPTALYVMEGISEALKQ